MKKPMTVLCSIVFLFSIAPGQDSIFVQRNGPSFTLSGKPFYAIGTNCYYLHDLAVQGDTLQLTEVIGKARELGFTTIRTWAFNDSPDTTNPAVIQFGPGRYNERSLQALDYVVAKVHAFSLRLVLTFVDNWDYYGGMNQYVRWLSGTSLAKNIPQQKDTLSSPTITGIGGRSYVLRPSTLYSHDDFYRHPTIKQWYKDYVSMILQRRNVYTGRLYKDEPSIIIWELANEPRSSDPTGVLVADWIREMALFVKEIDPVHCVGTGEEGYDVQSAAYPGSLIIGRQWMFDGTAGISFMKNIAIDAVDVASIHCYPDGWGFPPRGVSDWIQDHQRLAQFRQKPLVIGEVGILKERVPFFDAVFSAAFSENVGGLLVWQLASQDQHNLDGYQFSCPSRDSLCQSLSRISTLFAQRRMSAYVPPSALRFFTSYPNPFNFITALSFDLPVTSAVRLEVFDILGRRMAIVVNEVLHAGTHTYLFDASTASSGMYIARMRVADEIFLQKLVLVK